MSVLGIDPSLTATGVAWPDGTTEVIKWPHRSVQRLDAVYQWVYEDSDLAESVFVRFYDAIHADQLLVVIEGYSMGSARQQSHAHGLGELGGVLRLALHHCGIRFVDVPPACVKKYATGKGNANKDLVRDAARDRLGLPAGVTSDECDAAWLRQIGLALVGDPSVIEVPQLHRSALDKVSLPDESEAA